MRVQEKVMGMKKGNYSCLLLFLFLIDVWIQETRTSLHIHAVLWVLIDPLYNVSCFFIPKLLSEYFKDLKVNLISGKMLFRIYIYMDVSSEIMF